MTPSVFTTAGSFAGSTPSRTRSRKLGSTTRRWSTLDGPLSPMLYVVPASGLPSLVSRRKYGPDEYGPDVVTVHPLTFDCQSSAVARYRVADASSPLARARYAAHTRPAISV